MRTPAVGDAIRARAIAGTYAVLIALDATPAGRQGLMGFAIRRGGASDWMHGTKVFKSVIPAPDPHDDYSTLKQPLQTFLWGDYGVKPGKTYSYTIRPLYGTPGALQAGPDVTLDVETEGEHDGVHGVWFNRGAIASRAYAAKYHNAAPPHPDDPNDEQTQWLSRGLLAACLEFIDGTPAGQALRVAAYEFSYAPILDALKRAIARGVGVRVVYEAGSDKVKGKLIPTEATKGNLKAIAAAAFPQKALIARLHRKAIPHNKFIVRLQKKKKTSSTWTPLSVWTGSTNFSESGFIGQSNVGHLVNDPDVARQFYKVWQLLSKDPMPDAAVAGCMKLTPVPGATLKAGTVTCLFSPRQDAAMLKWYADCIDGAHNTVMFTAAFSIDPVIGDMLAKDRDYLRFALLEKPPSKKVDEQFKKERDLVVAYGNVLGQKYIVDKNGNRTLRVNIPDFRLDAWFLKEELFRKFGHVFFVHLKVLIVDPLTPTPLVCTGSANFSKPSLTDNDENMLLIRGDTRVADVYMTEFDRLLRHFYFRDMAADLYGKGDEASKFLSETPDWVKEHFEPWRMKAKRLKLFFPDGD